MGSNDSTIIRRRKDKFCKMRAMMSLVIEAAKLEGVWENRKVGEWTTKDANDLAEAIGEYFMYKGNHKRRIQELSWKTVFLLHGKHGKKFATEIDEFRRPAEYYF